MDTLLSIKNLRVAFNTDAALIEAVRGVSLEIAKGETLAIVGESGAGKSQVFHALMGLLPGNGKAQGDIIFDGQSILNQAANVLNSIRGKQIGMIFQDPMTALNPYLRIGRQLTEVLEIHLGMPASQAKTKAIEMLEKVHIDQSETRFDSYPHELSGGMRQRVVIAMALLCKPQLIIADEPTTALDVTVQAEIIHLLREIHQNLKTSIVLITHDLPLVTGLCERIIVMYAGRILESGTLEQIFHHAKHPYTQALLAATPANTPAKNTRLQAIDGQPPDPANLPSGCAFHPRCVFSKQACYEKTPELVRLENGQQYSCFKDE